MKCADCQQELKTVDFNGIQILECAGCHGRWFGRGELTKAKDKTDEDLRWLDFDPFGKDADQYRAAPEGKLCPECGADMDALSYGKSGVVIGKCQKCEGIWVHHGEFRKIIQYLESLIASETASEYVVDSLKQFLEIIKAKEGIAEEARDFLVILKLLKLRASVEHPGLSALTNKIYQYLPFL